MLYVKFCYVGYVLAVNLWSSVSPIILCGGGGGIFGRVLCELCAGCFVMVEHELVVF